MNDNHHNQPDSLCDTLEALIAAYAFGLTDDGEAQFIEANLSHCSGAATQLAEFRAIQQDMRVAVPQIEPSAALGERLMKAIAAPMTATSVTEPNPVQSQSVSQLVSPLPSAAAPVAPVILPRPTRQRIHRAWIAAAVAIIALLVSNALWIVQLNNERKAQEVAISRTGTPISDPIINVSNSAFVLKDTTGLRWVHLPDTQENGDASAFLMWDAESKIGLLYAVKFPKLADGMTYQLWLTKGEDRINAGTFKVDENGKGSFLFNIPEKIDKYTWARITVEPEAGSAVPTGTVVVNGKISA